MVATCSLRQVAPSGGSVGPAERPKLAVQKPVLPPWYRRSKLDRGSIFRPATSRTACCRSSPNELLRWSYQFGLVASLGGRHHWETLSSRLFSHLFHIPHIQTVPLFTVQYCYLNTRLLQSGKLPVFPRVAQGFVCWVFMQPRCLELPVLVPLCS